MRTEYGSPAKQVFGSVLFDLDRKGANTANSRKVVGKRCVRDNPER